MIIQLHEKGAASNNPPNSTYTINHPDYSFIVRNLQALRNASLNQAIKYRFDPTIHTIHDEYLTILNEILNCITND